MAWEGRPRPPGPPAYLQETYMMAQKGLPPVAQGWAHRPTSPSRARRHCVGVLLTRWRSRGLRGSLRGCTPPAARSPCWRRPPRTPAVPGTVGSSGPSCHRPCPASWSCQGGSLQDPWGSPKPARKPESPREPSQQLRFTERLYGEAWQVGKVVVGLTGGGGGQVKAGGSRSRCRETSLQGLEPRKPGSSLRPKAGSPGSGRRCPLPTRS